MVSNQNFINIKISYKNLVLIAFTSCVSLISCLCFLYHKLSIAHNSIEKLQKKTRSSQLGYQGVSSYIIINLHLKIMDTKIKDIGWTTLYKEVRMVTVKTR